MRKGELRKYVELMPNRFGKDKRRVIIYKTQQARHEHSDTHFEDVTFHVEKDKAYEAFNLIKPAVGYCKEIEECTLHYEEINDLIEFREEFSLEQLVARMYSVDYAIEFSSDEYQGEDITGAVIVCWSWEKYVGYAQNLLDISIAGEWPSYELKYESDLITGNEESRFRPNFSVLLTASEIEDLTPAEYYEAIMEALRCGSWKWNYFKNNPNSPQIQKKI